MQRDLEEAGGRSRRRRWLILASGRLVLLPPAKPSCFPPPALRCSVQVWRDGEKVEELVGASKDRLVALVQKYAS